MTKSFYEGVIADAMTCEELRVIHRFLVSDLQITGKTNDYIRALISKREAWILLVKHAGQVPGVDVNALARKDGFIHGDKL